MTGSRLAAALAVCALLRPAQASSPAEPCPVGYAKLSMPYSHEAGISAPTLELSFTNRTRKKIVGASFGLIVAGPRGEQMPYDQGLSFSGGADPGRTVGSRWKLDMTKIDIHKAGETVYLKNARFEDGTTWQDDGNQRCKRDEYFGPK